MTGVAESGAEVLVFPENRGKGHALLAGAVAQPGEETIEIG